mmetsp:Transcript_105503/g.251347  ORF Transcript_105503/g.251347 Transcript_105503/m.251347 type:complete len:209 (-) Transcript_105503:2017-2643(-)
MLRNRRQRRVARRRRMTPSRQAPQAPRPAKRRTQDPKQAPLRTPQIRNQMPARRQSQRRKAAKRKVQPQMRWVRQLRALLAWQARQQPALPLLPRMRRTPRRPSVSPRPRAKGRRSPAQAPWKFPRVATRARGKPAMYPLLMRRKRLLYRERKDTLRQPHRHQDRQRKIEAARQSQRLRRTSSARTWRTWMGLAPLPPSFAGPACMEV